MAEDAQQHTALIDALADPASPDWAEILGGEVRFRSPYADYAGAADVAHLLDLIREVLDEVRPLHTLREQGVTVSLFDARAAGEKIEGMLFERRDEAGRIADATLTIRPYAGLRAAMREMQRLLDERPLPSAAGGR